MTSSFDDSIHLNWNQYFQDSDIEDKHLQNLCIGMEKYLIFAQKYENSDCIFVAEPTQDKDKFFQDPEVKARFPNEKIIKILSLTKNLSFSSFYIFVLTKENDKNNYCLHLLNERFEVTKIRINDKIFNFKKSKSKFDFRIVDFTVCPKPQSKNFIPIVFIVKYLFMIEKEDSTQQYITYAAFFSSLNENEVMISNSLTPFVWNDKIREPIFFVPKILNESPPNYKQNLNERPTLIQFAPPYFIFFRNRMFNVIIIKKDHYRSFVLNDQPLHTAFCQFIQRDAALFVFNEIISIIDFSKQLNMPIHIFPHGKLPSESKFYYENNHLYIFSQRKIYKVSLLSTQTSDFSIIFEIQDKKFDKKPNNFTISCHNLILRIGNEFHIAKPKKAGTFAASMLIQNQNLFDCITSLDSQPTKEDRKQAYKDCFDELWNQEHKEEALMIACNRHFNQKLSFVVNLFEIFNDGKIPDLKMIEASNIKKEEEFEIYKRLKFYLDQCRSKFKEKGDNNNFEAVNSYIIIYLSYFHKRKELINFLKSEDRIVKKIVKVFFDKFADSCSVKVEEALYYAGIHDDKNALEKLQILNDKLNHPDDNTDLNGNIDASDSIDLNDDIDASDGGYHFSPRLEAVKIVKNLNFKITQDYPKYEWIFDPNDQEIGFYYFLPNEEHYESETLNESLHTKYDEDNFPYKNNFDFSNWACKFYIEWLRCKGLDLKSRLEYSEELFKKLREVQEDIVNNQSRAQKYLNENKKKIIWLDSIKKYFSKSSKGKRKNGPSHESSELNANSALEDSIKEIHEIIRETIITIKKYPNEFKKFKAKNDVKMLLDTQDIDFKKEMMWLIEDYEQAIELESESTTSESQIIKKCKQAINPAEAFKYFDKNRKDSIERKVGNDKYEWEEKIEFISLAEFIKGLNILTPLKTASPFLSSAISIMTSRIHNLEQRIQIQKQTLVEEKMKAAYDQIYDKVENVSKKVLNSE